MSETTGLTQDAGWELGVRTTVHAPLDAVWSFLLSRDGLRIWLGEIDALPTAVGAGYLTADGVAGSIRGFHDASKVRLTWRPDDWPHDTILQLTVKAAASGTTVGIHHEKLVDRDERRMMLGHWKNVTAAIDGHFASDSR